MRTLRNYISIITLLVMLPIIAVAQDALYVRGDYANITDGGTGSTWGTAINANAYYHFDGSHNAYYTYAQTPITDVSTNDARFEYQTIFLQDIQTSKYLHWDSTNKFKLRDDISDATLFYLVAVRNASQEITGYKIFLRSDLSMYIVVKVNGSSRDIVLQNTDGTESVWKLSVGSGGWLFGTTNYGMHTYWTMGWQIDGCKVSEITPFRIYTGTPGLQYAIDQGKVLGKDVLVKGGDCDAVTIRDGVSVYGSAAGTETLSNIQQTRPGVASASTTRTTLPSLNVSGTFSSKTVLDGLYINGAVTINDGGTKKLTLRNSIIEGATTVYGGLLYNSLVENLLTVHKTGNVYVANVSYNDGSYDGNMADYGAFFKNKKKDHQASFYDYQLDETEIDASSASLPTVFDSFGAINYDTDRDLLGNPRKMGSTVDNGAFEAWCVRDGTVIAEYDASRNDRPWNYYPVANTNVFIMNNSTFVLGDNLPAGYELIPQKLLLKEGAVLYGQGYNVNVSEISVEKTIPAEGLIMSLPFAHTYTNGTAYSYSGTDRSAFNYDFKSTNSGCWKQKEAPNANKADECEGVFFVPDVTGWSSSEKNAGQKVLRFSSKAPDIYTESGASKPVTLRQYDDYTSTDNAADFTSPENMGWNCIGIPYLVNDYKPYRGTDGAAYTSGDYMMQIPHTLWLYYDNTDSYQPVSSWDDSDWNLAVNETAKLWFGEGFFTQTATLSTTEALKFYRPVYVSPGSSAKAMSNTRYYVAPKKEDLDLDAEQSVAFNINRNMLTISNLKGDERIDIYTMEGMQKVKAEGNNGSYSCALRSGVYVVKVNDLVRKVMVR